MPDKSPHFLMRSGAFSCIGEILSSSGYDTNLFLRMAGLPESCISDDDIKVPTDKVITLLHLIESKTTISDIGLRITEIRKFSNIGAFGLLLREQATIRDLIKTMVNYLWVQAEGINFELEETPDFGVLSMDFLTKRGASVRQAIELAAGNCMLVLQRFSDPYWRPEMIMFRHQKPASLARHLKVFRCTPLFGQDRNAIILSAGDLKRTLPMADPVAAAHLTRYIKMISGTQNQDFSSIVREMITAMLPEGLYQMENIAQQLDIHPRTLHRRLQSEKTNFAVLLHDARLSLMNAHIEAGDKSLTEISELLGFSSLSAFSRWKKERLRRLNSE
jgi:AraC-like DNA-binding protein